ncbi:ABC transporter permease [Streptomyces sp. NRRL F-525]|uniref:ABC transporter permease n=1 Tax=Streptomyces sp. NRRL F-525 TaxID=1463861 RepID=UPI0005265ED4|nr:ABC transporter permease [Streptomyces sp. NRRL F-525]
MRRVLAAGPPVLAAVCALAGWWLATVAFGIRSFLLPSPPDVVDAFDRLPGYLLRQTWQTFTETAVGFGLAVGAGLATAVLLTASRGVERAVMPLLVAVNAVPKIAVAPLLVVWLGFGTAPKVFMVALLAWFPVVVSTMAGLTSVPLELTELARSLTASRWQTYRKLRIPWALPQVFTGLRLGVTLAVVGAVVGEFAGGDQGLGYVIVASGGNADTPLAFAAMALLSAMSVLLFYVVVLTERALLPWARETTG